MYVSHFVGLIKLTETFSVHTSVPSPSDNFHLNAVVSAPEVSMCHDVASGTSSSMLPGKTNAAPERFAYEGRHAATSLGDEHACKIYTCSNSIIKHKTHLKSWLDTKIKASCMYL